MSGVGGGRKAGGGGWTEGCFVLFCLRFSAQISAPTHSILGCVPLSTMSGAYIATLAFRVVLEHGRTSLLQRQLREIDLLVRRVPEDPHLDRMRSRAYALRSIEYCEDILVHLRTVLLTLRADDDIDALRRADDDIDALCIVVINICKDVQDDGTYPDMNQMDSSSTDLRGHMLRVYDERMRVLRSAAMYQVTQLLDIIVGTPNLRPWAREHLDLHGVLNWYRRLNRGLSPIALGLGYTPAEVLEIWDLLLARTV